MAIATVTVKREIIEDYPHLMRQFYGSCSIIFDARGVDYLGVFRYRVCRDDLEDGKDYDLALEGSDYKSTRFAFKPA